MQANPEPSTYAVGDVHGTLTLLRQLIALLPFTEADTLVFLGDYLDRGEDSLGTIHFLMELAQSHPRSVFLRGNHEDAWLQHWDGLQFTAPADMDGALDIWDAANGQIPYAIGHFLETTLIDYEDTHAIYVHAGLRPHQPRSRTSESAKLWGVPNFLASPYDWGKPVVFGHTAFAHPLLQPNKIGIDTGAYKTGILTAVRLPDRALFQTQ